MIFVGALLILKTTHNQFNSSINKIIKNKKTQKGNIGRLDKCSFNIGSGVFLIFLRVISEILF